MNVELLIKYSCFKIQDKAENIPSPTAIVPVGAARSNTPSLPGSGQSLVTAIATVPINKARGPADWETWFSAFSSRKWIQSMEPIA